MSSVIKKKAMHAPELLNEPIEYGKSFSRGIRLDYGGITTLFISGTASVDEKGRTFLRNDFSGQAKRTFKNLTALLRSENASWNNVVQTRCYLKNMEYYEQFNEIRNVFYKKEKLKVFPASVCVEANLCRNELLIEIEAVAVLERKTNVL